MTATDWRSHATDTNQQRFADAQARLDDGDYPPGDAGRAQQAEDQRFADWYDQAVNAASQEEFERQCEDDELNARWPEPADGTRMEWEADGLLHAAYRQDVPEHEGGSWWLYGRDGDDRYTWGRLVAEYRFPEGLADVALLVDTMAACKALDAIISDYPIPPGVAAGVESDFHAWTTAPGHRDEVQW